VPDVLSQTTVILLVDADEDARCGRSHVLSAADHRLLEASTGREAILMAAALQPHLIVLAANVSNSSWVETCKTLKANPTTVSIPLLLIGHSLEARITGLEAGVDVCLAEPTSEELLLTVRALLRLAQRETANRRFGHMEAAWRESEERLRVLVDGVRDYAIFMLDPNGHVSSWNQGAERLLGYRAYEVLGKDHSIFYGPEALAVRQPARDLQAAADGRYELDEWRVRHDRTRFFANVIITALPEEDATLRGFAVVMRDVTERKCHERELVEQARLLDLSNDAIVVRDQDDRILYWNHGAEELYGWSEDEAVGRRIHELLQTEFPEPVEQVTAVLHRDHRWTGELIHRTRGGKRLAVLTRWVLDWNAQGRPASILETSNDITEQKEAERFIRRITDVAPSLLYVYDVIEQRNVWGNREMYEGLGYRQDLLDEMAGDLLHRLIHPEDWPHYQGHAARLRNLADGEAAEFEYRMRHADGSWRWLHSRDMVFQRTSDGTVKQIAGAALDITERKQAEEELARAKRRTEVILDSAGEAIFGLNAEGLCTFINPAGSAMFGYRVEELVGKNTHAILHHSHPDGREYPVRECPIYAAFVDGKMHRAEGEVFWHKEGRPIAVSYTSTPVREAERLIGAVVVIRDITERKRTEDTLRTAYDTFRHLVEHSPFGVYAVDADFHLVQVSAGAQKVFENVRPLIGRDFAEVLRMIWPEPFATEAIGLFRHTLETGEPYHSPGTVERRRDIGEVESYDWKIERVMLPDGRFGVVCHFYDLSERQRYEAALRENEERFRMLAEAMPHFVWQTDAAGEAEYQNQRWYDYTGLTRETTGHGGWLRVQHPDDAPRLAAAWKRAVATGGEYDTETRFRYASDGTYRWFRVKGAPVKNPSGRIVRWVGTGTDIHQGKEAEEALRESEMRLQAIMDRAPTAIFIKDRDGRSLFMNVECARILAVDRDAATGKTAHELFPASLAEQFARNDLSIWESGQAQAIEEYVPQPDGLHTFLSQKFLLRDANGKPYALCGIASDITLRRRMEEELRQHEEQLRIITDAVPSLIAYVGRDERHRFVNAGYEQAFGLSRDEIVGRSVREVFGSSYPEVEPHIRRALEGEAVRFETDAYTGLGHTNLVSYTPDVRPDGTVAGYYVLVTDISERKRQEDELRRWKDELEVRVSERTKELLMSHQRLRDLASQVTLTEQRERRKLARDLHDYLAQLLVVGQMKTTMMRKQPTLPSEVQSLFQDVGNIFLQALTYTRTMIAELSPPSLQEHGLPQALKWLAERFEKDGLSVEVRADCQRVPLPEDLAVMLFQAVRELLFNVLKHAGVDRATVTVTVEPAGDVRVVVADRGKGLSADAMRRAYTPGHLGLFSVRERLESFGGYVDIVSAPGQGATVTLWLPMNRTGDSSVVATQSFISALPPTKVRVLLVDDHAMVRQGVRSVLEHHEDIEIVGEAGDGEEAVALAARLTPDVVLMDMNMPKMNGLDATKCIKAQRPSTVVLAVTVHHPDQMKEAALAAGATGFVSKETATDLLYDVVRQAVRGGQSV